MTAANHIQHRLALLLFDDFKGALERRRRLLRVVDHLAVAAMGLDDLFVSAATALTR